VKLVKGEGRATRARSLALPRRAVGESSRVDRESFLWHRHTFSHPGLLRGFWGAYPGPSTSSMSIPGDNGAPVDSVNRPAFGYTLNLLCVILFEFYLRFHLNTCTYFVLTGSLIFVMNLLIISGIKMYRKLPNCLTVAWIHMDFFLDSFNSETKN
jgi:hypothetical protein